MGLNIVDVLGWVSGVYFWWFCFCVMAVREGGFSQEGTWFILFAGNGGDMGLSTGSDGVWLLFVNDTLGVFYFGGVVLVHWE